MQMLEEGGRFFLGFLSASCVDVSCQAGFFCGNSFVLFSRSLSRGLYAEEQLSASVICRNNGRRVMWVMRTGCETGFAAALALVS